MARETRFLTGNPKFAQQARAVRHERETAKALDGHTTVASGSLGQKGDVWAVRGKDQLLVECKMTVKQSLSLKIEWLEKVLSQAIAAGRKPLMVLRFTQLKYASKRDWVLLPLDAYEELVQGTLDAEQ